MVEKTNSTIEHKKQLRAEIQARRRLFSNSELIPKSIYQIKNAAWFHNAKTVAIYVSQAEEFPTRWLFDLCVRNKKTIVAPVMSGTQLKFFQVDRWESLVANEKNILEPAFGHEVKPETVDVFFVPLLAFDRSGNRLGRGGATGGYYDRLFSNSNIRGKRVGVGFEIQEYFTVPTEPHDQRMDFILTELKLHRSF
jgi:5-formyltetrahydrofolate cyclo-ligase